MKAYLAGSSSPTIPSEFSRFKQLYFEHGHADRSGVQGGGSPLFMLNVHMWRFGRPQPTTFSVQQRQASRERARKAANLKTALRNPFTQEKAARRRAMHAAHGGA